MFMVPFSIATKIFNDISLLLYDCYWSPKMLCSDSHIEYSTVDLFLSLKKVIKIKDFFTFPFDSEWQQKEPNGVFTHASYAQLEELFHVFEKLSKYLHKVIAKLMECGYQRHLVELLTMINLNGYYDPDKSKEELNASAQP